MRSMFRGFVAVFYKEALHMRRDSMAIMFAIFVPSAPLSALRRSYSQQALSAGSRCRSDG